MPTSSEIMDNTLLPELDKLYSALNMSAVLAKNDEEWEYVNERISSLLHSLEDIISTTLMISHYIPRSIVKSIKNLYNNIKEKNIETTIIELNNIEEIIIKTNNLLNSIKKINLTRKIIFTISVWVIALYMLYIASTTSVLLLAILSSSLALAGMLLHKLHYSDVLYILSIIIILLYNIFINEYILSFILTIEIILIFIYNIIDKNIINDMFENG